MNSKSTQSMMAALVDDLSPVQPISVRRGMMWTISAGMLVTLTVLSYTGMRDDLMMGSPHPMFFLRFGALLLLGLTSSYAVVAMSQPGIGNGFTGWVWALLAALLFPASAIGMTMIAMPDNLSVLVPQQGMLCLAFSGLSALAVGTIQVLWLRRGAPVALARAGWLVGMASGAMGAAGYSLHCPFNSIFYVGLWYTLAVAICAVIGRILVPRLIRW